MKTLDHAARAAGITVDAAWQNLRQRHAEAVRRTSSPPSPAGATPVRAPAAASRKAAPTRPSVAKVSEAELAAGFRRLGLGAEAAGAAARGRRARQALAGGLREAGRQLGLSSAKASTFARGRRGVREAATRTEPATGDFKGGDFPATDYAYVPDAEDPSTWQLLLTLTPGGTPDPDAVRGAVQAIDPANPLDNPVPADALPDVVARLTRAWSQAGLPAEELPPVLSTEALRASLARLGVKSEGVRAAVRGRLPRRTW